MDFLNYNNSKIKRNKYNLLKYTPIILALGGCTTVPLRQSGTLTSYTNLSAPKGKFTKKMVYLNKEKLSGIKTVSIWPATFTNVAEQRIDKLQDRLLVTNALDRATCFVMSEKYQIVPFGTPSDLTIRAVITDIVPTQPAIAGVAKAVSIGSSLALPVGIPRLPLGLGGLAVEAEALDSKGSQAAAIIWSKGANSFTNEARISQVGDAYDLAAGFGSEFSRMIIAGKEPGNFDLRLPSAYDIRTTLGGKPGSPFCETYGRSPGIVGMIGASLGAPPTWADKGAKRLKSTHRPAVSTMNSQF